MEIKFPNQKSGKWSVILGAPRESGDNTSVLSFGYCKGFIEHLCKSLNLWSGWPRKDLFYNMYCLQWFISVGTSARNKQNLFFLHKVSVVTRLSDNHCINVDPVSLRHCINVMCPLGRHVKSFSFFVRLCNFCVTWMCYIKTKQKNRLYGRNDHKSSFFYKVEVYTYFCPATTFLEFIFKLCCIWYRQSVPH